jgi:hypothetical protein
MKRNRNHRNVCPPRGLAASPLFAAAILALAVSGSDWLIVLAGPPDKPPTTSRAATVPVPLKVLRYAQHLVQKNDRNGDGTLDEDEWSPLGSDFRTVDLDRDGTVSAPEIAQRIARYGFRRKIRLVAPISGGKIVLPTLLNPATEADAAGSDVPATGAQKVESLDTSASVPKGSPGRGSGRSVRRDTKFYVPRTRLPQGLPPWFSARDADGDAQLTMAEFAPKASQSQLDEFALYDRNRDGVITAEEAARGPGANAKTTGAGAEEVAAGEKAAEQSASGGNATGQEATEATGEAPAGKSEEKAEEGGGETTPEATSQASAGYAAPLSKARIRKARSRKSTKPAS